MNKAIATLFFSFSSLLNFATTAEDCGCTEAFAFDNFGNKTLALNVINDSDYNQYLYVTAYLPNGEQVTKEMVALPFWLTQKVYKALILRQNTKEIKQLSTQLNATQSFNYYTDIAKYNALVNYYAKLRIENVEYAILPAFHAYLHTYLTAIETKYKLPNEPSIFLLKTSTAKGQPKLSNVVYGKTIQQIETEIDQWFAQYNTLEKNNMLLELTDNGINAPDLIEGDLNMLFKKVNHVRICRKIDSARVMSESSYKAFKDTLEYVLKDEGISYQNIEKYASDNIDKITCPNRNNTKMRETSSIFKFSIDTGDYQFVRDAIFVEDENGKNHCNPNLNFFKAEIINGKEENLLDFINSLLATKEMGMVHDFVAIKNIKLELRGCLGL